MNAGIPITTVDILMASMISTVENRLMVVTPQDKAIVYKAEINIAR
jgi:hypothetical protein